MSVSTVFFGRRPNFL